jgi:hypothetical protein
MSIADWYHYKAGQSVRLADMATDALKRAAFKEEAELWRSIARDGARQERDEASRSSPLWLAASSLSPRIASILSIPSDRASHP